MGSREPDSVSGDPPSTSVLVLPPTLSVSVRGVLPVTPPLLKRLDSCLLWSQRCCSMVNTIFIPQQRYLRWYGLRPSSFSLTMASCSRASSSSQAWSHREQTARHVPTQRKLQRYKKKRRKKYKGRKKYKWRRLILYSSSSFSLSVLFSFFYLDDS